MKFPEHGYSEDLLIIDSIRFTPREIDVISCLFNARGTNKIASFLLIFPKTVRNHIHNIMIKVGCNSRDDIIGFIEKSDKISILKRHYTNLLISSAFQKSLKEIYRLRQRVPFYCKIVHWSEQKSKSRLVSRLESDLKVVGLHVSIDVREKYQSLSSFIHEACDEKYAIYILPNNFLEASQEESSQKTREAAQLSQKQASENRLFLLPQRETSDENSQKFLTYNFVDLETQKNYFSLFFEILLKLFPNLPLEKIIAEFKQQHQILQVSLETGISSAPLKIEKFGKKENRSQKLGDFPKNLTRLLPFIFVFLCIFLASFLWLQTNQQKSHSLRSDLIIPTEAVFLDRPQITAQIDAAFNKRNNIQVVALSGPGGAGKTTLARQYARFQKSPVIWEINAETRQSLKISFEALAQSLAKTEEDKAKLSNTQNIKISSVREEKIIQFVKDRLKVSKEWFLIFDNVEKFVDIQKYFPRDSETWGEGRIILTTRDGNIQNNSHVDNIILIKTLDPKEKFILFQKIMNHGSNHSLLSPNVEEIKKFLENIPPFPLDVSIAAYYIKATHISPEKYLKLLFEHDNNFTRVQEHILKETGDYIRTRYSIITLSLKQLVETHDDFEGLLLFIGLLNSQNIPRNLLGMHQNDLLVDEFIYNLQKYSLISDESSSTSLGPTLTIHQSIQPIIIAYLIQPYKLEQNKQYLQSITNTFKKYLIILTETEDILKMKLFINHIKTFLSHNNLLSASMKGSISIELGCIYFHLYHYVKAKKFLEEGIENLNNSYSDNPNRFAWALVHLGCVYRELGNYEKAKNLLEEGLSIYKKHLPENYVGITNTLTYLGIVYRKLGNYKKAKDILHQSISIYERGLHKNHIGAARSLANLAYVYQNLGDIGRAKELLERSLTIFKKYSLKNQVGLAWIWSHLGSIYQKLGNNEKAKRLLQESLVVFETYFSENHNEATWVLAHIGDIHKELGNYKEAKRILEKTLIIYEKSYGPNHIKTGWILKNLGQVYFLEGNIEIAEDLIKKSLNVFQQNNHPDIYMVFEDLSDLFLKRALIAANQKDKKQSLEFKTKAISNLKQALEVLKTHFRENSPHTIRIQLKLNELDL